MYSSAVLDQEYFLPKAPETEAGLLSDEQSAIYTTWSINVEELKPETNQVLRVLSMVGNAPISEAFLKSLVEWMDVDDDALNLIIDRELVYHSCLITKEESIGDVCMFDMHRLIRQFVLKRLERDRTAWDETFNQAFLVTHFHLSSFEFVIDNPPKDFQSCLSELVQHTLTLVQHNKLRVISDVHYDQLENLHLFSARMLEYAWRDFEVEKVLCSLLQLVKVHHGGSTVHPVTSNVFLECGRVLRKTGRVVEAAAKSHDCLQMEFGLRKIGLQHSIISSGSGQVDENLRNIAFALDELGMVCMDQGKLRDAKNFLHRSYVLKTIVCGVTDEDDISKVITFDVEHNLMWTVKSLGTLNRALGKFWEAKDWLEECLSAAQRLDESESNLPLIADTHSELGRMDVRSKRANKALWFIMQSYEMRRVTYGNLDAHPDIASSLQDWGNVYYHQGEHENALRKYQDCLKMREKINKLEPSHSSLANVLSNIARVHAD